MAARRAANSTIGAHLRSSFIRLSRTFNPPCVADVSPHCPSSAIPSTANFSQRTAGRIQSPPLSSAAPISDRIRNFSIVAHVDHGKSTLADRLLELTGTLTPSDTKGQARPQYLDKLQVERERGITVKAQLRGVSFAGHHSGRADAAGGAGAGGDGRLNTCITFTPPCLQVERERGITVKAQTATMLFDFHPSAPTGGDQSGPGPPPGRYLLNLIDTPGHVDFSYEVSRSLAATQGVLLVVDAQQGIQAQTVANFFLALEGDLAIVPVVNKIDRPDADPQAVAAQIASTFDLPLTSCLFTSARTGAGLPSLLSAIVRQIPPPPGDPAAPLRALLLDAHFDEYRGVVCHVAVVDGAIREGEKVAVAGMGMSYDVGEVGVMYPEATPTGCLLTGQVGYVMLGMRTTREARVGDTIHHHKSQVSPLPGFRAAQHMVFAGVFPADGSDFEALAKAVDKLVCNDASVAVTRYSSAALGAGFRCGFLGLLHMDVFHQRLQQEFGAEVISTAPSVPAIFEYADGTRIEAQGPSDIPSVPKQRVLRCTEPFVLATIVTPSKYVGPIMDLCASRRGEQKEYSFIDGDRAMLRYDMPVREVVMDFYSHLKSISSGFATFDYEDAGMREADLVKVDVLLNGKPVDALAAIAHRDAAQRMGRKLVERLKGVLDRQMFEVVIQAAIGAKVIASEKLSAMRKNVLAKCYGGDVSRKRKLLEKQKEGKKRMKRVDRIGAVMGSPSVMDEVRKVMAMVTEGNEQLQQAQEQASAAIRETTAAARQQMAVMEAAASEQLLEAKASLEVAREVYTQYEDVFFHHLKMGVYLASEHRVASSTALLSALAFILPGPRKMLYRATFGRFQTPEVLVESAERKLEGLKQSVEVFKNDTKKLQERAQMAESEFLSGRDKLKAAGAEMQRLAGTVRAAEKKSLGLRELLKDLPARDSVRLRSELAMATREAQRQLHAINKTTVHMARLGIPI
ncbi:unnamed protein product [Closterium sp. NIES-64]|nr:unnamed protein product [Closterium sp. NIES-64]